MVDRAEPLQERPWLIFSAGALDAGKGHVMDWMSKQGIFGIEHIVHANPDYFKLRMPEFGEYTRIWTERGLE